MDPAAAHRRFPHLKEADPTTAAMKQGDDPPLLVYNGETVWFAWFQFLPLAEVGLHCAGRRSCKSGRRFSHLYKRQEARAG